jgi:ABC-2 type transport system permease protein
MNVLRRILALTIKEFLAILKDPKSRFVVIGPPLIQFFVYGYAATFDVSDVRYAVLDESRTPESRELLSGVAGSRNFRLVHTLSNVGQIRDVIDSEEAHLVLHVHETFSRDLHSGKPAELQVIIDGRNSNVASIALGYVSRIVMEFNRRWYDRHRPASQRAGPVVQLVERAWYNQNLVSRWFIVSALGGVISMVVVMLITSLSVAREREHGTFDQLLVTPFTPVEILIGKSVPAMVFGLLDALFLSLAAVLWFQIPFLGSVIALIVSLAVFILSIIGVGLFVSSLSTTMQQGLLGSFIVIMPSVILSGYTTPIANMPHWLQTLTRANPLRYIVAVLREIFLEGATLSTVAGQLLPMLLIAMVTLSAAGWFFRHRVQ